MPDTEYSVSQGDCLSSIADTYGFYWKTLWNHNSALRALRKVPNILFEGDVVLIPEKELRMESRATDQRHKFVRKGTPAKLRIVVERFGQPLKNKRYILTVDGTLSEGVTSDTGLLDEWISPSAREGTLEFRDENLHFVLDLGYLDPVDEIVGVQRRLQNLGLYEGPLDGALNDATREAIQWFQSERNLTATGDLDAATRKELTARHDQVHAPPPVNQDSSEGDSPSDEEPAPDDPVIDPAADEQEMERLQNMDEG